jgi:hypothetical protein
MKLLNVRLAPEDARMVAHLKQEGVQLSGVVREAIRVAYDQRVRRRTRPRRLSALIEEIYLAVPDRAGLRRPGYDLRDRKSVRRAIAARLRRRRS